MPHDAEARGTQSMGLVLDSSFDGFGLGPAESLVERVALCRSTRAINNSAMPMEAILVPECGNSIGHRL